MSSETQTPVSSSPNGQAVAADTLRVTLKTLTGQLLPVQVPYAPGVTPVAEIKRRVERLNGVPPSYQRLIFSGRELQDSDPISNYGIQNDAIIHLVLRQNQPVGAPQPQAGYYQQPGPYGQNVVQVMGQPMQQYPGAYQSGADAVVIAIPYPNVDPRLRLTFQLGRAVKLFAILDVVLLVIWAISFWPLIVAVIMPMCGYYGAHLYIKNYVFVYVTYMVLSIGARIYFIATSSSAGIIVVLSLGILIELYIIKLVWRFVKMLNLLTPNERMQLIQYPPVVQVM